MSRAAKTIQELLAEYQELPEFTGVSLQSVNQRGVYDSTPLHIAIYRKAPNEVTLLLKAHADPNAPGEYGERPLHVAVNCRQSEIIEHLLRAGARCDLTDDKGRDVWQLAEILHFSEQLERIYQKVDSR
jgi:ankyrin repeat protein